MARHIVSLDQRFSRVVLFDLGVGIAGKASLGLNRPVRFRNCTLDEARKAMMAAISPEWVIEGFTELYDLIAQGYFATLSPDLALLTFDKGVTVAEFFRENTALFNGETDSKSAGNELVFPSKL